jgi:hypothetical protein
MPHACFLLQVGDEVGADCSILGSMDDPSNAATGKPLVIKQRFQVRAPKSTQHIRAQGPAAWCASAAVHGGLRPVPAPYSPVPRVWCAVPLQEGSVDEVSFVAPELGPLAAIMVAPEGGSWVCDEVDVYSSRSNHTDRCDEEGSAPACRNSNSMHAADRAVGCVDDCQVCGAQDCTTRHRILTGCGFLLPCRFVCRQRLGGRKGEPAAYLTPVPLNAVVYGTGDAARIITKVSRLLGRGTSGLRAYGAPAETCSGVAVQLL